MENTEDLFSILTAGLKLEPSSCGRQVVVVTGAGRGIGLQTARAFAMLGAGLSWLNCPTPGETRKN